MGWAITDPVMQKFWQQETDKRAGLLTTILLPALIVCLLTGSAYGSGLVGSNPVGTEGGAMADRHPAVQMVSLPQDAPVPARKPVTDKTSVAVPAHFAPLPPRKPETTTRSAVASLLRLTVPKKIATLPPRKPETTPTTPVPANDAPLYKEIFDLQAAGNWKDADALLPKLTKDHLRGHVLFQRYMHPAYKSSFAELESWLARYADLPGA
ncbi:MAG: hypothetical protein KJ667_03150, partial [Alphaproteobacteria bacterium]|nr:hypothetical protein [Alphaproteobacteria bacterium]